MPAILFYDVVTAVHVIAIVLAFGVTFAYPIIFPYLGKNHPQAVAPMHDVQERLGKFLITPFATLALVTGIYLAADRDLFDRVWVQVPMAILIILLGLGGAYFAPTARKLGELARTQPRSEAYFAKVKQASTVGKVVSLLILAAIFLMVAKPGGY
jgi:uncharacterized membrane protein